MNIAIWWQQESWGGVDAHLAALIKAWPVRDKFTIFHNETNPGLDRVKLTLHDCDIEMVPVPDWRVGKRGGLRRALDYVLLPVHFWRWTRRARDILVRHARIDVLIADNGSYPGAWTCLAALSAAKRLAIPKRILLVHHAAAPYSLGRSLFERVVDRLVQSWASDLVAVSRATRDTLIRVRNFDTERNPIRVIHNGVQILDVSPSTAPLRRGWGISDGEVVIGMIGRIERYKGHEDVLLAIAELPDDVRSRVRLVIVGDGPAEEKARLRDIADKLGLDRIILFTGYVCAGSSAIAAEFDLLVMATKDFEGFGLAAAEAMSVGTPVLATAVGGITEFLDEDVAVLVPPEAPSDLAAGIESVVRDPLAARRRAERARQRIAKFSDVVMAQRFQRLTSL